MTKVLVVIANHGTKNQFYLQQLLAEYRTMSRYTVDIVVLSDTEKQLGPDVEVRVGAPTKNPWSLPFGYKSLFAERLHRYDLFIYTEDDTLIRESSIAAFLEVTSVLPPEYIAGFLRVEWAPDGTKYFSTMHGHYHWDPNSVVQFGQDTFAYYTNEHSACFIMTRDQLRPCIENGSMLAPAREGQYDMLVTAATDPYTQCGMKKLICISRLDDFSLHHLPNVYCGRIGLEATVAEREISRLLELPGSDTVSGPLFDGATLLGEPTWDKQYYAAPDQDLLSLVPTTARKILSVGCGCGSTEAELVARGADVWAVPLDCVTRVTAEAKGIRCVEPELGAGIKSLAAIKFDCILFAHVLHHLPDPVAVLKRFLALLHPDGIIVIGAPNFRHLSIVRRNLLGKNKPAIRERSGSFAQYRIHFTNYGMVSRLLKSAGLAVEATCNTPDDRWRSLGRLPLGPLRRLLCRRIAISGRLLNSQIPAIEQP